MLTVKWERTSFMDDKTRFPLTAAEMTQLWAQSLNDTASICFTKQFANTVKDEEVKKHLELALSFSQENVSFM